MAQASEQRQFRCLSGLFVVTIKPTPTQQNICATAMTIRVGHRTVSCVNGDRADLQAQFSLAYAQAVASVAGFFVQYGDRGFDKDGIDMTILKRGDLGLTTSTRLDLQVKSYSGEVEGDPWSYDLDVKAYRDLSATEYQVPRVLLVVRVPAQVQDWLIHSEDQLVLRRCGYWHSLRGAPATSNTSSTRVQISRKHRFDVAGLVSLMENVAHGVL
jgi:hypothetical protein